MHCVGFRDIGGHRATAKEQLWGLEGAVGNAGRLSQCTLQLRCKRGCWGKSGWLKGLYSRGSCYLQCCTQKSGGLEVECLKAEVD